MTQRENPTMSVAKGIIIAVLILFGGCVALEFMARVAGYG